mgnify:CR=1 FL=1
MTQHYKASEYARLLAGHAPSKYKNIRETLPDGTKSDSRKESKRLFELRIMQSRGEIRNLIPSKGGKKERYPLEVNGVHIADYEPDSEYEQLVDGEWIKVVEDVKSEITKGLRVYIMKKRLMLALYGIEVQEV